VPAHYGYAKHYPPLLTPLALEPEFSIAVIQGPVRQFKRAETAVKELGITHADVPVPEGKGRSVRVGHWQGYPESRNIWGISECGCATNEDKRENCAQSRLSQDKVVVHIPKRLECHRGLLSLREDCALRVDRADVVCLRLRV
jgi:hypothetical protein